MSMRRGKRGPWLGCSAFPKCRGRVAWTSLEPETQARLERELVAHEAAHPQVVLKRQDGTVVPEGTPISQLLVPGGVIELTIHPDAKAEEAEAARRARKPPPDATPPELAAG
jgi:DNA topoisomerase-1